jgi:hypothetical protein
VLVHSACTAVRDFVHGVHGSKIGAFRAHARYVSTGAVWGRSPARSPRAESLAGQDRIGLVSVIFPQPMLLWGVRGLKVRAETSGRRGDGPLPNLRCGKRRC